MGRIYIIWQLFYFNSNLSFRMSYKRSVTSKAISGISLIPSPEKKNSYFSKHRVRLKKNLSANSPAPQDIEDSMIQAALEHGTSKSRSLMYPQEIQIQNIKIMDRQNQHTDEEQMYQQYKEMEEEYRKELKSIKKEIEMVRGDCEQERKKVKTAEQCLRDKKKELNRLEQTLSRVKNSTEIKQLPEESYYTNRILQSQQKLEQIKLKGSEELNQLDSQHAALESQNKELSYKLEQMQSQLDSVKDMTDQEYKQRLQAMAEEETKLREEIAHLESEGDKIRIDIERIQQMKPMSADLHRKYLDLYEKMFLSKEIGKAEQILLMKDNYKKENEEFQRRKEWIKEKKIEINLRERRIGEKNKQIDTLTQDIREKSTMLLNLYTVKKK